ncbi:unnamed protein product [Moneuplotes crassus]|uniref:Uncharacterized protein n=1 Tax=Euplotes crassus TaxID=5936 RepID=A0AAD2DA58_EUPCR|nr:unnamed protein product [Moneuplotes crassus]
MNRLTNLLPKLRPTKKLNIMSNYDPHDINAEYEAVGADLRQMATQAFTSLKTYIEPEYDSDLDEIDAQVMHLLTFQL